MKAKKIYHAFQKNISTEKCYLTVKQGLEVVYQSHCPVFIKNIHHLINMNLGKCVLVTDYYQGSSTKYRRVHD